MPLFSGVMVPWTTPPIISGFLNAGWQYAVIQVIILFLSVIIYYPFARKYDNLLFNKEKEVEKANAIKLENS